MTPYQAGLAEFDRLVADGRPCIFAMEFAVSKAIAAQQEEDARVMRIAVGHLAEIASTLSMDPTQVNLIRTRERHEDR